MFKNEPMITCSAFFDFSIAIVPLVVDTDTFFPEIDDTIWKEVNTKMHDADEKHAHAFSFITYLKKYIKQRETTVLITSHVMSDLEDLIDDMVIVQKTGIIHQDTMENFNKDTSTNFEDKFLDFVGLY